MDFAKHVLIWVQSAKVSDCGSGCLCSPEASPTEPPGERTPAAPARSPRVPGTERTQCSEAHRWEFKWGQDHWEKCWKGKPGQQTAPFCLAATLEPGPESNDYKLAVVWVDSASCSHFQMFGPGEDPRPHFATQWYVLFRSFQESVHSRVLDFLLVKMTHTCLGPIDSKGREEGTRD